MSNVTLQIGGRSYTVACAEGEESHVTAMGAIIARKVEHMGPGHSETRQLLFAALLLADELDEARSRATPSASAPASAPDPALLEALADRLEKCATALEG